MIKTHLGILGDEGRAGAFATVYEEYVVPIRVTVDGLRAHIRSGDIVLEESPLWRDDAGETIGLGLLGVRGDRGWVGGFGVAKAERGKGHSRPLAEELLDRARHLGLRQVQLEVIDVNALAIRTYERCGFRTTRDLRFFSTGPGESRLLDVMKALEAEASHPGSPQIVECDWRELVASTPPVTAPCWQRERESLAKADGLLGFAHVAAGAGPSPSDGAAAYAVVKPGGEVVDIAALNAPDETSLREVAGGLAHRFSGAPLRLLNEPADSPLCPWLEALGFQEKLRQHEMVAQL